MCLHPKHTTATRGAKDENDETRVDIAGLDAFSDLLLLNTKAEPWECNPSFLSGKSWSPAVVPSGSSSTPKSSPSLLDQESLMAGGLKELLISSTPLESPTTLPSPLSSSFNTIDTLPRCSTPSIGSPSLSGSPVAMEPCSFISSESTTLRTLAKEVPDDMATDFDFQLELAPDLNKPLTHYSEKSLVELGTIFDGPGLAPPITETIEDQHDFDLRLGLKRQLDLTGDQSRKRHRETAEVCVSNTSKAVRRGSSTRVLSSAAKEAANAIRRNSAGAPRFKCNDCFMAFRRKDTLMRHEQTVHQTKRMHVCPVCTKHFKRADHLRTHLLQSKRAVACRLQLQIPEPTFE